MSVFKVASRYAKSLIDLASEQGSLETIKTDMDSFIAVLKSSTELQAVLANPIVPLDKKKNVLDALFKDSLIGGFVVNIGDRQIDASIAGKLNKLERYLNQNN